MTSVAYLPLANNDLVDTWLHIAQNNVQAADAYIERIRYVCILIAENPLMGVERDDLREDVRSFPVENHVIFYTAVDDGIVILRVWPALQDPHSFTL